MISLFCYERFCHFSSNEAGKFWVMARSGVRKLLTCNIAFDFWSVSTLKFITVEFSLGILVWADGDEMAFKFFFDEFSIIDNSLQIFFWAVIKLNLIRVTIVRKSWEVIPSYLFFSPWEMSSNKRWSFCCSLALKIFTKSKKAYMLPRRSSSGWQVCRHRGGIFQRVFLPNSDFSWRKAGSFQG